jgi:uncharacterized protein
LKPRLQLRSLPAQAEIQRHGAKQQSALVLSESADDFISISATSSRPIFEFSDRHSVQEDNTNMADKNLKVGNLTAAPGEKVFGVQEITVAGQPYNIPTFVINGKEDGPTLAVTGGVHAAEYASIAAALELGQNTDPATLRGQLIIVPIVNTAGFPLRSIYINPIDGINLNRVFPGDANGSASEQITHWVFNNVMKQGDYYVDMHGGDLVEALVPFTIFHLSGIEEIDAKSLEIAEAFGIPYLVRSESLGGTHAAAARAGIPAILTEAGGQGIWPASDVKLQTDGMNRLMRHLGMLAGPAPEPVACTVLQNFIWLRSEHDGFWYPAVEVGAEVTEGQNLGCIKDYEGNVLQEAVSPANGSVLFLVSSLAINDGDPLMAIGA